MVNRLAIVVLLIFLLIPLAIAEDVDLDARYGTEYPPETFICNIDEGCDVQCESIGRPGEYCYCDDEIGSCFYESDRYVEENGVEDDGLGDGTPPEDEEDEDPLGLGENDTGLDLYDESYGELQSRLDQVETAQQDAATGTTRRLAALETDAGRVKQQLAQIRDDLATLQNSVDKEQRQSSSLSTGQASLQQDLVVVEKDLERVEEDLAAEQSFTSFVKYSLFLLVAIAIGLAVYYYLVRKKMHPGHGFGNQITDFINSHIKKGRKYPYIKQALMHAGWLEQDIRKAYDSVVMHNYQKYKQSTSRGSSPIPGQKSTKPVHNKKKITVISLIGIFVLIGAFLLIKGVTGQAINYDRFVDGVVDGQGDGIITYNVTCTWPHLLNPLGDACCLDNDNTSVCDHIEARLDDNVDAVEEGDACTDNIQCPGGQYCIDGICGTIASTYEDDPADCEKTCEPFYALTVLTSDNEIYKTRPNQGSYTGAGALEWKILTTTEHCSGEAPVVPINLLEKNGGEIIREYVVTALEGDTTAQINHGEIDSINFNLTMVEVNQLCDE
jgi:hypothetical protein